ncbi:aldehyde dehydrogenase family protein [Streptomyces sp. NPDC059788]|uniref:aldehyde dehydrogenase family protein n=1 Tax=Streptomyces sp. NPDC059788 TaxID=3346948 RepID=UPI003649F2F7
MGVAGLIAPWNSPVILLVRALGPAIGAGCTTVVKMPGQTAVTNALFAEAVAATRSLPAGVVNILTEAGNEVAPLLVGSPDVDVLSYTGSTRVGRAIAAAAAPTLKRANFELGGKTPLLVFDDADLDVVVPYLVTSCILMNGEFCCTGSRVLAQRGIADELRTRLAAGLEAVEVGPAEDPSSQMGPLTTVRVARPRNARPQDRRALSSEAGAAPSHQSGSAVPSAVVPSRRT